MPSFFEYLIRWGGVPGVITLLFGLITLAVAGVFMARPRPQNVRVIVALSVATLSLALGGVLAGASMSLTAAHQLSETRADWPVILVQGLAESLSPGVTGFTLVSLSAFLTALGLRRLPAA